MRHHYFYLIFCFILSTIGYSQNIEENSIESEVNSLIDTTAVVAKINLDSIGFKASSKMLDETMYWSIIEKSLQETTNQEDQEIFLISEIEKLSPEEMIGFRLRTDQLLFDSYTSDLWCANYIISNGIADDGFDYFRCWLISRGKEAYYKAKENPDFLVNIVGSESQVYDFEGFWYVALSAFKNVTDKEGYDYIDYENFKTNDEHYPVLAFNWNVDDAKTMEKICPILYQKFWKK